MAGSGNEPERQRQRHARREDEALQLVRDDAAWTDKLLGILGRRLLDVCVKFSEDEVELGVRSTSADTLSDQPLSEWPAGWEADRTLAQRTAAVGLTDRGSRSQVALVADHPLRLADDHGVDLGGPRRSLTGGLSLRSF